MELLQSSQAASTIRIKNFYSIKFFQIIDKNKHLNFSLEFILLKW